MLFLLIRLYFRHFWNERFSANFRHHTSALQSGLLPHINLVNSGQVLPGLLQWPDEKNHKTGVFCRLFLIRAKQA